LAGKNDDLDLSGLSPEEIAAIDGDDHNDTDALDEIIGDEPIDGVDPDNDEDLDNPDNPDADNDASATDPDEPEADEPETVVNESKTFQPQVVTPAVENYEQRMQEFDDQKAELRTKLNDGDIDLEEYEKAKDKIVNDATELRMQQRDHENDIKRVASEGKQRWEWEQEQFFGRDANKVYSENALASAALDTAVKALARDPKNGNQTGSWFLEEADRQVRALMTGLGAPATKEDPKKAKQSRKPDLSGIPKTLATIPAAETVDTGETEFAYLDKLSGASLEQALAAIARDPAKEQRYLRT
jgi:hypothetical protein